MALDDGTAHPWEELPIQQPRHCVELSGRRDSFVVSGEFVLFRHHISTTILNDVTLHSPVGRILRIEHVPGHPSRALVNLFFFPPEMPSFPPGKPDPPRNRMYIEFPTEVFWSNYVQWIPQIELIMEAFVFLESDVVNGSAGFCVGMENGFFIRYQWTRFNQQDTWIRLISHSQFQSFPFDDCCSKRAWEIVLKLARLIFHELSRSSITQHSRRSDYLDFHPGEWQYLRSRLGPEVEVVSKSGVSTVLCSRKNGTKEVIKCRLTKYSIRLDTTHLFSRLQNVLGKSILCGLRLPPPPAPKMRARDTSSFAVRWASNNDSFNLFFPLPATSLDLVTHRPIHRGIDFAYDSTKSKLRVAIRFRRAYPGDPSLRDHLDFELPPQDKPEESSSSDSESNSDSSANDVVEILEGQTIGSRTVVLEVRRITAGATHAICNVVESLDNDYVEGTERVLTMAEARRLYAEYHNDNAS
jgi:hypothetical protein